MIIWFKFKILLLRSRCWLERNEIFFRIFATLAFSVMTIIIAYQTMHYTALQVTVAKAQNVPVLKFDTTYEDNGTSEFLTLHNIGGSLNELVFRPMIFYKIEFSMNLNQLNHLMIPIDQYYDVYFSTNNPKDLVALAKSLGTNGNLALSQASCNEFQEIAKKSDIMTSIYVEKYAEVRYKDIFDEEHHNVYAVGPFKHRMLSPNEASEIISQYETMYYKKGNYANIYHDSGAKLFDIFTKNIKK
ncbi:hypothetical protein M7775_05925 [Sporomusa sphaeroides DSM 2875]|uniref:hypothetical protein n=1 Tax=Sporomusa sphaeroides TaxID=47679 RepID=UPI00202E26FB|nr:hypothetical protein [Sporomusa sphaeroides]MCM0758113.1 hypothetical protein [Sporomusa sphaeroides DSM 2875]